jgi:hypothetical protein
VSKWSASGWKVTIQSKLKTLNLGPFPSIQSFSYFGWFDSGVNLGHLLIIENFFSSFTASPHWCISLRYSLTKVIMQSIAINKISHWLALVPSDMMDLCTQYTPFSKTFCVSKTSYLPMLWWYSVSSMKKIMISQIWINHFLTQQFT